MELKILDRALEDILGPILRQEVGDGPAEVVLASVTLETRPAPRLVLITLAGDFDAGTSRLLGRWMRLTADHLHLPLVLEVSDAFLTTTTFAVLVGEAIYRRQAGGGLFVRPPRPGTVTANNLARHQEAGSLPGRFHYTEEVAADVKVGRDLICEMPGLYAR